MTKEQIRSSFKDGIISFSEAMCAIMCMGFTEFAAEQYLFKD